MMTLTVYLVDTVCSGPAADCKQEVATGVRIFIWLMACAAGLVCAWNLLLPYFSPGDTADNEASEITHAGRWFKFLRRVLPTFITLLLLALILNIAQDRLSAWAGG